MAKRKIVDVDEDVIKKMIAGDMASPVHNITPDRNQGDNQTREDLGNEENTPRIEIQENGSGEQTNTKPQASRKRKAKSDYSGLFLVPQKYVHPRQTTIILDNNIFSSIRKVLKITDGLTLAGFVNNVLRYHFNEYKEEITTLRRDYMSDLYDDE